MYSNPVLGTDPDGGGPDDWYTDTHSNLIYDANVTSQADVDLLGEENTLVNHFLMV